MATRITNTSLGRNVFFAEENISVIEKQQDEKAS